MDDLFGFLEDLSPERRARITELCSRIDRDRLADLLRGIPPARRAHILEMANVDIHEPSPLAEQLEMAYREVSAFDDTVELDTPHQRKIDRILAEHHARMATIPLLHEGVLGGLDGTWTAGNPDALWLSPRGSTDLPTYDPDDPTQTQVPILVPGWCPDHEWAVRAPSSIADVLGWFTFDPRQPCDWHFGAAKTGTRGPAVLVRTQGQVIALLYVCGSCRDILTRMYGGGLLFLELDENRQVQIPRPAPNN